MKYPVEDIIIADDGKAYIGDLLIWRKPIGSYRTIFISGNNLCIELTDRKTRKYPLSKDVIYELSKLTRKVLIEKTIKK